MNDNKSGRLGPIEEKAQEWFIRLRNVDDADPEKTQAEFNQWLALSTSHQRAYRRAEALFAMGNVLKTSIRHGADRMTLEKNGVARYWMPIGIAAAAAAILITVFYRPTSDLARDTPAVAAIMNQTVSTARGEIREVRLADGSTATLDTDSRLEINISKTERLLRLSGGRARFEVATDPRAFRVQVGAGEVIAQQAVFDVAFNDDQNVSVEMISGNADIRPVAQYAVYVQPTKTLPQGSRFTFGTDDFMPRPVVNSGDHGWPGGWVERRSISLGDLIILANKYAAKPIILDDSNLADLKVSGRFNVSDPENLAVTTQKLFNLVLVRKADGLHLRRRK